MAEADYSIGYRRWHSDTEEYFEKQAFLLSKWMGKNLGNLSKDAHILDFGCGFGFLSYYLKKQYPNVRSVDASATQLAVARKRGLSVELVGEEDFSTWVRANLATFDVVFLMDVLEHIPVKEQIDFLRGLLRTLRTGGTIYVKVPNASSPLAARWRYIDFTHQSSFTEASLSYVCENAGLVNLEILPDESSWTPRMPWIPRRGMSAFYVRTMWRYLWRLYLKSELGEQARTIPLGHNLLIRAHLPHV